MNIEIKRKANIYLLQLYLQICGLHLEKHMPRQSAQIWRMSYMIYFNHGKGSIFVDSVNFLCIDFFNHLKHQMYWTNQQFLILYLFIQIIHMKDLILLKNSLYFSQYFICAHNIFQNQKENIMSIPPKFPISPYSMRAPYMFPGMNSEKMMNAQQTMQKNNNVPQMPAGLNPQGMGNIPPNQFFPHRMFNPFLGGYGMMPVPPYTPYSPFGRQPPNTNIGMRQKPLEKTVIQNQIKNSINYPLQKKSQEVIEVDVLQKPIILRKNEQLNEKQKIKIKQPLIQRYKKVQTPKLPIRDNRNQPKKQSSSNINSKYTPYDTLKKKQKQDYPVLSPTIQRKTREKKPSIERIFIQIMKEKPQRDMVMKIGKDHQAIIPQSYLNQFQYALKIKMEKKNSLLTRMITEKQESEPKQSQNGPKNQ